jgi:large subunit ribosomal protein L29
MKNKDITSLSTSELVAKVKEEQVGYEKLKFNHAISPIENPLKIRSTRRMVARLNTELSKRNKATK